MKVSKITPDDPRLTAYALGELDAAEHVAVETAIKNDPEALAAVAQVRALGGDLSAALAKEPLPFVVPLPQLKDATKVARHAYSPRAFWRLPFYLAGGLAAACFVAFLVIQKEEVAKQDMKAAQAHAAAQQQRKLAMEKAKQEGANSGLIEVELRQDGNNEVHLPAAASVASDKDAERLALLQKMTAHRLPAPSMAPRPGYAAAEMAATGAPVDGQANFNTETYDRVAENDYLPVVNNPVSTFSVDVDTASYANMRRFLSRGQRPPRDAVRIEEMVNYFPYDYAAPKDDKPFATSMEVASAPWNPQHRLVRIGLKGREIPETVRPAMNLVFLLDVSGSMNEPNKLPLVQESMRLLVEKLKPSDRVAIVVYAGASGLALPSTAVAQKKEILSAIDDLRAGGSTNGAMGIHLAYDIAKANFIKDGANRVVLCTGGDFNVGVTNQGDLTRLVEEKAKSGVFLTALGFGMGNLKDSTLQKLADKGNGNYGYVDTFSEAKKLLSEQLSGTLMTIAKDVKLQVEFNPALVQAYRLIGYEKRLLRKEDFNNDKIDAGEIGAGHTVTALYEIVPVGAESPTDVPAVDALKYQATTPVNDTKLAKADASKEMLTLKIRYKAPASDKSSKLEFALIDQGVEFAKASQDFKFAAAVAGFGMVLRESPHKGTASFDSVLGWAESGIGKDNGGYRQEFMALVKKAKGVSG